MKSGTDSACICTLIIRLFYEHSIESQESKTKKKSSRVKLLDNFFKNISNHQQDDISKLNFLYAAVS